MSLVISHIQKTSRSYPLCNNTFHITCMYEYNLTPYHILHALCNSLLPLQKELYPVIRTVAILPVFLLFSTVRLSFKRFLLTVGNIS